MSRMFVRPVDSGESRLVVDRGGLLLKQLKLHEQLLEPLVDEVELVLKSGRGLQLSALPVRVNLLVHLRQQVLLILELPQHRLKRIVFIKQKREEKWRPFLESRDNYSTTRVSVHNKNWEH